MITVAAILLLFAACSPSAGQMKVNGRTLLTHTSSGTSADAALTGILHVNAAGCVAVGTLVLVVPTGSTLNADGSIVVAGTTYKFGSTIHLGGGGGNAPHGSPCGAHSKYWYV